MTDKSITKNCIVCNKEFKQNHKPKKFCSVECYRSHQRSGFYKKDESQLLFKELIKCDNCNKDFYQFKHKIKVNIKNFCSRDCYLEDHKIKIIKVNCKTCNKEKILTSNDLVKYNNGKTDFYCNDQCRSKRERVLTCKVCNKDFCSIQYRESNNEKGFTIVRPFRLVCSDQCLKEFYKTDKSRKGKISIALSGENHPNYVNGISYNGRIRKTDIKENFGKRDKLKLLDLFNNKCFKCGSLNNLTIDHHLPFSKGGLLTFTNCVILCKSCNSKKNAKMPQDFYTINELEKLKKLGIDHNSLFSMRY